jgi:hypothetical protein
MGHRKERPARQGAKPQLMRGEPRRGDRANVPVVASRQPLTRGDPGGGRRGALVWRQEHWPDSPALLRPSGRCTTPGDQPARKAWAAPRAPTHRKAHLNALASNQGGSDAPGHSPATGPMLTSLDSALSPSEITKETAWAPFHTAPHPSGSKDQAGLLRSPCSHSGGGRLGGVPRRSFHGDSLRSLLPDPCPGDACLSRWHQGVWP